MKTFFAAVAVVVMAGCGLGQTQKTVSTSQPLDCSGSEVPVYSNRFAPSSGSSGVASYADAAAGKVSDDNGTMTSVPPPATDPNEPQTAMVATCGTANCAAGQVAIEIPPPASTTGGGDFAGPDVGAPAGGADDPAPAPAPAPAPTLKCATPPPTCAAGLSPQYTAHDTWECTDCSLVVTYGGIYGNYRRCVNAPTVVCPEGQVPTWSYESEQWECKPTCDNGMYDQHTINGQLVCVPC